MLQQYANSGVLFLYVGINSSPVLSDPSTYMMAAAFNTTGRVAGGLYDFWTAPPIYVPASACSSYTVLGEKCTIVFLAVSTQIFQEFYVTPQTSVNAVWLHQPDQPTTPPNATAPSTTYQFSLATTLQAVTVSVNVSSAYNLSCSYQYVTPTCQYSEWNISSGKAATGGSIVNSTAVNATQLHFTWDTQKLQTNPTSTLSATPTTCYCTVDSTGPYSISYSTKPLQSPPSSSSSDSLSSGALAAAVVIPIMAVLVLAAAALWLCRGRQWGGRAAESKSEDRSHRRLDESSAASNEVSLADLSGTRPKSGQLMSGGWRSDRA